MPNILTLNDCLERIQPHLLPDPETGCWLWQRSCMATGYGQVRYAGTTHYVHRLMWSAVHGAEVPNGLEIDHSCRVRRCCNPDHLEAVTRGENVRRATPFRKVQTVCARGLHPLRMERPPGKRACLPCGNAVQRARRARKAEK